MGRNAVGHWADHAAELGGASALAIGCGVSAWLLRSFVDLPGLALALAAVVIGGVLGWLFVHGSGPSHSRSALPMFKLEAIPLTMDDDDDDDELLLDNPTPTPIAPSRVVDLFGAGDALPTAGELQRRIDRHLGSPATPQPSGPKLVPDASDALFEALADLRRSLRRG